VLVSLLCWITRIHVETLGVFNPVVRFCYRDYARVASRSRLGPKEAHSPHKHGSKGRKQPILNGRH
jgi:hypothetical protein